MFFYLAPELIENGSEFPNANKLQDLFNKPSPLA